MARRNARERRLASTNSTACCSVIVLPRFSRCARASAGESLNRTTFPSTTAVAYMVPKYPKRRTETSRALPTFSNPHLPRDPRDGRSSPGLRGTRGPQESRSSSWKIGCLGLLWADDSVEPLRIRGKVRIRPRSACACGRDTVARIRPGRLVEIGFGQHAISRSRLTVPGQDQ